MITTIIYTIVSLVVLGLLFSVVLYLVAQKFKVEEDPRIDVIESLLPGANCGGCGLAGCRAFAEDVVKAPAIGSLFCPVGGDAVMEKVAAALGKEAVKTEPKVAVIKCHGTFDNRSKTNFFDGYASCKVMSSLYSGDTGCKYGCLGKGDCVNVCLFDAIRIDERRGIVEVDEEKCVACGACVKACPKSIIELRPKGPKNRRVYVSCSSRDKGAIARKVCSVSCIGCGKCVKACPFDAITLENNLAYIDPAKCKLCRKCVDECPTKAIWAVNFPIKVPVTPKQEEPVTKTYNREE
jgi:Na+-translocating ferredoxin:NAD+ oxidoreductase RNF subunit RnfB